MVDIGSLYAPILISTALVWFASALVWLVLPHHKSDFRPLVDEERARAVLGEQSLAPGQYDLPHCGSAAQMRSAEWRRKLEQGPVAYITVLPNRVTPMGRNMLLTLVHHLVVSTFVAYVASRVLAPGAAYLAVFQVTGTIAWLAHGFAIIPDGIWFGRPWPAVFKTLADALAYGLITAGVFGWQWPG